MFVEWMESERSKGRAPATLARRAVAARQFGKFLGIEVLADYKAPAAAPVRPHPLPGGMSDVDLMLEACDGPSETAMVILCGFAGMRISEARSVTPASLETDDDALWARIIGKGYKAREVPIPQRVAGTLRSLAYETYADDPLVALTDSQARKAWKRIADRAGVRDSSTHDGRATVATEILDKTGNLRLAQEILGHSSVSTTQRYTGVTRRQLVAASEVL